MIPRLFGKPWAPEAMGFRAFLQGLKPGEIGFCIASVGACSATLLASNKIEDGSRR
jgi:hypothetical protein